MYHTRANKKCILSVKGKDCLKDLGLNGGNIKIVLKKVASEHVN